MKSPEERIVFLRRAVKQAPATIIWQDSSRRF
jgi:hypothetical protein